MVIEEKLKLNKFREVAIPKPSDIFARLGFRTTPDGAFSGEETLIEGNKIEQLSQQMNLYEKYAEEEARKETQKSADDEE